MSQMRRRVVVGVTTSIVGCLAMTACAADPGALRDAGAGTDSAATSASGASRAALGTGVSPTREPAVEPQASEGLAAQGADRVRAERAAPRAEDDRDCVGAWLRTTVPTAVSRITLGCAEGARILDAQVSDEQAQQGCATVLYVSGVGAERVRREVCVDDPAVEGVPRAFDGSDLG